DQDRLLLRLLRLLRVLAHQVVLNRAHGVAPLFGVDLSVPVGIEGLHPARVVLEGLEPVPERHPPLQDGVPQAPDRAGDEQLLPGDDPPFAETLAPPEPPLAPLDSLETPLQHRLRTGRV